MMRTPVTTRNTVVALAADKSVEVPLTFQEQGEGRAFLVLHGGAGPQSVAGFTGLLARRAGARVIAPVHPGFAATDRPQALDGVPGLAGLYTALLDDLDLDDVTVIGNSLGGWIAAEIGLLNSPRVSGIVLLDPVGIDVADHPVTDVSGMTPDQVMALSFHDPAPFRIDPTTMDEGQRAAAAANRVALQVYAGTMTDPTLRTRLRELTLPTLVLWGESDEIVTPAYGRAFADAIPGARFAVLPRTGHMPQLETPDAVVSAIVEANVLRSGAHPLSDRR
jgi:pimeloyl-ACP methyl ester carboxylesterase